MKHGIKNIYQYKRSSLEKLNQILSVEFITNADSYLHYSNQILFDINGSRSFALVIILNFFNNISAQIAVVTVFYDTKPRIFYADIKEFTKTFDGVIGALLRSTPLEQLRIRN
ncbi:MAG: hypothetical protein R2942_08260 [Ignavibacteria bacterium]